MSPMLKTSAEAIERIELGWTSISSILCIGDDLLLENKPSESIAIP